MKTLIRTNHRSRTWTLCLADVLAVGFTLAAMPSSAEACKPYRPYDPAPSMVKSGKRWKVSLSFRRRYFSFKNSNFRLQTLSVFTADKKLARFLVAQGRTSKLWNAIRTAASKRSCKEVISRVANTERALARAIAAHYRRQTRRYAPAPDLMLSGNAPYRLFCR